MTTKTPNYTPELTAEMIVAYREGVAIETIAKSIGKTAASVIAKLSREGVYEKPARTTKNGEAIVKKDSLADDIGVILGLPEGDVTSLTKANKSALKAILAAISPKPEAPADAE